MQTSAVRYKGQNTSVSIAVVCPPPCLSLTQDYELEAEKLRSLLDLENGRSSHVTKRARLQSPAAKVREEVSGAGGPWGRHGTQASEMHPNRETGPRALLGARLR